VETKLPSLPTPSKLAFQKNLSLPGKPPPIPKNLPLKVLKPPVPNSLLGPNLNVKIPPFFPVGKPTFLGAFLA